MLPLWHVSAIYVLLAGKEKRMDLHEKKRGPALGCAGRAVKNYPGVESAAPI